MRRAGVLVGLVLSALASARHAPAASIQYNALGAFQLPNEVSNPLPPHGLGDVPGYREGGPRSRNGQACPAETTPDFLCGYIYAGVDRVGSTLSLHTETRMVRRQGVGTGLDEIAVGDARIEIFGLTGVAIPTSGWARFDFALDGEVFQRSTNGAVTAQAIAVARLTVNEEIGIQCLGSVCPPIEVRFDAAAENVWDTQYIGLQLRAESHVVAPLGATFDADAIVDVRDTLKLLAIEVLDDDRQPVPGAAFVADLGNGDVLTIPSTPPPSTTTTSSIPGGSTTTTTTLPPGLVSRFVAGKTLALKDDAKPTKRKATLVVTGDVAGLDPTQGGAEVRLYGSATATRDTWALPAAGWKMTKKGYKYTDKARANGPITAAVLAGGKLVVKAKGPAIAFPLLGTGPQQAIATGALFPASSTALCADFTTPKKDDPAKGIFVAHKAPAPAVCRAL